MCRDWPARKTAVSAQVKILVTRFGLQRFDVLPCACGAQENAFLAALFGLACVRGEQLSDHVRVGFAKCTVMENVAAIDGEKNGFHTKSLGSGC